MSGDASAASAPRRITTIDLWKTAALLLILADHLGLFLFPDEDWLRALGRAGAPIFFFLIGFTRTRSVPWFWLVAGAALTGLDYWRLGSLDAITLNILLSFAAARCALPFVERHVAPSPWRFAALVAVLVALIPFADMVLEYGVTGWLWVLVGLAHRLALESGPDHARRGPWLARRALGAATVLIYGANEVLTYGFGVAETWIMAAAVLAVGGLLLRFRRADIGWSPPAWLAAALTVCGRRSLEIYIAQIVGLMALGAALGIEPADAADDGDEDT